MSFTKCCSVSVSVFCVHYMNVCKVARNSRYIPSAKVAFLKKKILNEN